MRLSSGDVPDRFKVASHHWRNAASTTLSLMCHLCPKIVTYQQSYLETNNMLNRFQSGFHQGHSSKTALTNFINYITVVTDSDSVTVLMLCTFVWPFTQLTILLFYIDLNLMFDYVKLCWSGLNTIWLINVKIIVNVTGQIQYWVPQGQVPGPLLFSLYLMPLGNIRRKHNIITDMLTTPKYAF